jgi:hypothetical protein
MKTKILITALAMSVPLSGCNSEPTSTQIERAKQEELSKQAITQVGMPAVVNFAEKRMLKDIIELRDKMQPTYTYLAGEQQGVIGEKICDSLGYGISAATQFTNPQRIAWDQHGNTALPQADPNGLYSPAAAEGTWVMCKVPGTDKIAPQYIEPRVLVLTFPKESRK